MKHVKLYENFQLIPKRMLNTGNDKFFGEAASSEYSKTVRDCISAIMAEEHAAHPQVAEKESAAQLMKEEQQLEAIIHNCYNRNFRPKYAAETAYHALIKGRMEALAERPAMFGGLKESGNSNYELSEIRDGSYRGSIKGYEVYMDSIDSGFRATTGLKNVSPVKCLVVIEHGAATVYYKNGVMFSDKQTEESWKKKHGDLEGDPQYKKWEETFRRVK